MVRGARGTRLTGAEAVVVHAVDAKEATGAAAHEAYGMYWHGGLDLDSVELPE